MCFQCNNMLIAHFSLQLKLYNGKKWKKKYGEYYDHWKTKLDLTYDEKSPMKTLVDEVIAGAEREMDTKKWKKLKKEDLQSGSLFPKRFSNYSKRLPYARWKR